MPPESAAPRRPCQATEACRRAPRAVGSTIRRFELTRSRYPQESDVTGTIQSILFATPEEVDQLRTELIGLLSRYVDRLDPARRPADSYPFEIVAFTHVLDVPSPGAPMRNLLRIRNVRIYLLGDVVSTLGDNALWLAMAIWVKEMTGSSAWAGSLSSASRSGTCSRRSAECSPTGSGGGPC